MQVHRAMDSQSLSKTPTHSEHYWGPEPKTKYSKEDPTPSTMEEEPQEIGVTSTLPHTLFLWPKRVPTVLRCLRHGRRTELGWSHTPGPLWTGRPEELPEPLDPEALQRVTPRVLSAPAPRGVAGQGCPGLRRRSCHLLRTAMPHSNDSFICAHTPIGGGQLPRPLQWALGQLLSTQLGSKQGCSTLLG